MIEFNDDIWMEAVYVTDIEFGKLNNGEVTNFWPNETGNVQCIQRSQQGDEEAQALIARYIALRMKS